MIDCAKVCINFLYIFGLYYLGVIRFGLDGGVRANRGSILDVQGFVVKKRPIRRHTPLYLNVYWPPFIAMDLNFVTKIDLFQIAQQSNKTKQK